MSDIVARISLYAKHRGISIRQIEIAAKASNGVFSQAIKKGKDIQAKWLSKILYAYKDINPAWLTMGEGEMLQKSNQKDKDILPTVITVDTQSNENIIFVPVKASAGYLNGYADPEYIHQLAAYRLPGVNNGVFRMFEISGQSMKETLEDGDKVVGEWALPADIKDGHVYIIVSKTDGICVKRCVNRLKSDNKLILKSDNKEFDNTIINAENILEAWSAKLRITSKFNTPSLYRITENAKDAQRALDTKLSHTDKFNDFSEALKRITDLEARLAYTESRLAYTEARFNLLEQSRSNNP